MPPAVTDSINGVVVVADVLDDIGITEHRMIVRAVESAHNGDERSGGGCRRTRLVRGFDGEIDGDID